MKKNYLSLLGFAFLLGSCTAKIPQDSLNQVISSDEQTSSSSVEENNSSSPIVEDYKQLSTQNDLNKTMLKEGLTPSLGNVKMLIIPVHFIDTPATHPIQRELIDSAFNGTKTNTIQPEWTSVKDFYQTSSYGKLNFSYEITPTFTALNPSTYYSSSSNYPNYVDASMDILKDALTFFDANYDYSEYDSNQDGYLDGVYLIYDHEVNLEVNNNLWWAYTYYYDRNDTFDGMKLNSHVFAGQDFFLTKERQCDTHTIIHETAHMFGIDDYYDYDKNRGAVAGGLAGGDLMDQTLGDHNSFTKGLLNWNTTPTLITTKESVTLTLKPLQENGDYIILANNFDESLGLNQEYFILEYYTNDSLQSFDTMFHENGIRMLHISANLSKNGKTKYDNSYTTYKLISQITTSSGSTYVNSSAKLDDSTLFLQGESFHNVYYNGDLEYLHYTFHIDALNQNEATITFTYKN